MSLRAGDVLLPGGVWSGPAAVTVCDGVIEAVDVGGDGEGVLTAGLIDVHNNGAFGVDFATADADGWAACLAGLAARGVTAVLPTVITAPLAEMAAAVRRSRDGRAGGARVLGVHLEGPFLSTAKRGAHRAEWLMDPAADAVDTLLREGVPRMVTLAPERPGALTAIRQLVAAGVIVSLGHSDADAATVLAAVDAGATSVTHVFNAMRPVAGRDPGLAGVGLSDGRLWCCLIVDGLHVDPVVCRMAFAAAGARLVAVSDSVAVAGMAAGATLPFGGAAVTLDAAGAGRRADGTLAGAGIVLDEGVRRMIAAGVDPAAVLRAATEAPARMLGRSDLGRVAAGARADLVWWDAAWVPRQVWVGGVAV